MGMTRYNCTESFDIENPLSTSGVLRGRWRFVSVDEGRVAHVPALGDASRTELGASVQVGVEAPVVQSGYCFVDLQALEAEAVFCEDRAAHADLLAADGGNAGSSGAVAVCWAGGASKSRRFKPTKSMKSAITTTSTTTAVARPLMPGCGTATGCAGWTGWGLLGEGAWGCWGMVMTELLQVK